MNTVRCVIFIKDECEDDETPQIPEAIGTLDTPVVPRVGETITTTDYTDYPTKRNVVRILSVNWVKIFRGAGHVDFYVELMCAYESSITIG